MPLKNNDWDGTWLRVRLDDLGLTQKQFAERIRVDRNTVNRWAQDRIPLPAYAVAFILLLEENRVLSDLHRHEVQAMKIELNAFSGAG